MHNNIPISNTLGHRDVFITNNCNPHWAKIQNSLLTSHRANNRPNLCDWIFRLKLKLLLKHLTEDEPFAKLAGFVYVIELQKRGLVHTHIIAFLENAPKFSLQDPTKMENLISAEITPATSLQLR